MDCSIDLGAEAPQIQLFNEIQQFSASQVPAFSFGYLRDGAHISSQGEQVHLMPPERLGLTEQQRKALEPQTFAFPNLKKGEGPISRDLSQANFLCPPELQLQQSFLHAPVTTESAGKAVDNAIHSYSKGNAEWAIEYQHFSNSNNSKFNKGKAVMTQNVGAEAMHVDESELFSTLSFPLDCYTYKEPMFDIPFYRSETGLSDSPFLVDYCSNLSLSYDVKEILSSEGREVLNRKRMDTLEKISGLLALNVESKRINPDLVMKLKIQEKKLRLLETRESLRKEVDLQQQEIMAMDGHEYRKFVRSCERQQAELAKQVELSQMLRREKHLKSIFQGRKKFLKFHRAIRGVCIACNKGVVKYHEKMLNKFYQQRHDEERRKRTEALKNNDVNKYCELLTGVSAQRYTVLLSFLSKTEEYLDKLGKKITSSKHQWEATGAASASNVYGQSQGFSEEDEGGRITTASARGEAMVEQKQSVSKYYSLVHATDEITEKQPSLLTGGALRDYQLVGLQWMVSLYNNHLNGILADEMGLGKTVQVMALIAYLMEFKRNYGPHLIIVPNAVLVNWKTELRRWLPSLSCIFYAGGKNQRSRILSSGPSAMSFNVLVTTYEFIMYDRAKLSKFEWKYIVIDEAQRMKNRESVLARNLDRYRCQRRLLLSGTPLQNDLKELWSLLNILVPEVFDDCKVFRDWFSKPFQKDGTGHTAEDEWLETEKKVIIIHRLHQILEPFMLRRRIEDVEGSLPRKVSVVLRCRMSAVQAAIYDWIKFTGTLKVDPEVEERSGHKKSKFQKKVYKSLNNKCMELRKVCNHPLLNYPFLINSSKDFIVTSCGKLWILDRILMKLKRTGHKVLLFSTMTKLLDILEEYLEWRHLVYRRIDGETSLEDRESAISDFNCNESQYFMFLLSIRAAGRGLNLQTADTVIIYDPDPNPQNEEQAVSRAHRIGQRREVKVIYMESVVDKISSHEKEDEFRHCGFVSLEDEVDGKDRYIGSIESLIRNNIQQYKIEMADEVINAGRFDQNTSHEERRITLEALLNGEGRCQQTVHDVPSSKEVNRLIARSEEEVILFDQMDEECGWTEEMVRHNDVPRWLRANSVEANATLAGLSNKLPKSNSLSGNIGTKSGAVVKDLSFRKEKERVPPISSPTGKSSLICKELDNEQDRVSEIEGKRVYSRSKKQKGVHKFSRKPEESFQQLSVGRKNDLVNEESGCRCSSRSERLSERKEDKQEQVLESERKWVYSRKNKRKGVQSFTEKSDESFPPKGDSLWH